MPPEKRRNHICFCLSLLCVQQHVLLLQGEGRLPSISALWGELRRASQRRPLPQSWWPFDRSSAVVQGPCKAVLASPFWSCYRSTGRGPQNQTPLSSSLCSPCLVRPVICCVLCRKEETVTVYPADVVLFEGILAFYSQEVRDLFQMKLFVDTDADTRLSRRGVF